MNYDPYNTAPEKPTLSGMGIASICCGGGSFFLGGLPVAVLAIVFALIEKKNNLKCGKLWMIGFYLGIANCVIQAVTLVFVFLFVFLYVFFIVFAMIASGGFYYL
ncbi:MAG: hypothetical protein J6Q68_01610 [Clostridia bacterium]|nr:hypothetical protein [Clostridia bacterium]